MKPDYETFEHTADIGLRSYGANQEELFRHAARGLFELITDLDKIKEDREAPVSAVQFNLNAEDCGLLLLKWLRELLYLFSTRKLVPIKIDFEKISETCLEAKIGGKVFDPERHEQRYEVKAITYHEFGIQKENSDWIATVIVDI